MNFIYIKKVVLELLINMVSQMKNTARVKVAHTLGGQDVVIGNLLKKGVFMEELKDQVIFLLKERDTVDCRVYLLGQLKPNSL